MSGHPAVCERKQKGHNGALPNAIPTINQLFAYLRVIYVLICTTSYCARMLTLRRACPIRDVNQLSGLLVLSERNQIQLFHLNQK